ncbi:MAG: response regulator [Bacteroidia bacterium]|nr:response regulator [Bacteroidia bacterium]MCF8425135.1 response regulator [Bacteroidia bacterium]MCF8448024.1 response regulator [Bacteroidia bacterium]
MSLKAIVIDDERMARTLLKGMIEELRPEVSVVELCADLPSGIKAIHKHQPDFIFLDIEMPGHSGLEILSFLNEKDINFSIIFTTAYSQYAVQAFKLSALDYLLKPVTANDLETAIDRAIKNKTPLQGISEFKENFKTDGSRKLAINTVNAIRFVDISQILYIKADGAYTQFLLEDESLITSSRGLKYYEEVLQEQTQFLRCHKSYLVNLSFVKEYVKTDGGSLILSNNQQISISYEKVNEMLKRISILKK